MNSCFRYISVQYLKLNLEMEGNRCNEGWPIHLVYCSVLIDVDVDVD
jgi:hypothetical protein